MRGNWQYVPVLKLKPGEKRALADVAPSSKRFITPLLEVVERDSSQGKSIKQHIAAALKDLPSALLGYDRCFLDTREIHDLGPTAVLRTFRVAESLQIPFVPVTGPTRTVDVAAALAHSKLGLALRIDRDLVESGDLAKHLYAFEKHLQRNPSSIDLIVDLGPVDDMVLPGVAAMVQVFYSAIPVITQWRSVTLSACAFPQSMAVVPSQSHKMIDRMDWLAWKQECYSKRAKLPRLPYFSDCAVQHTSGVEGFDFRIMPVSATVRYAVGDQWLLVKGKSTRALRPTIQFPRLASSLVSGNLRRHFAGNSHCAACELISAAANGASGFGAPVVWRRLGTAHHLSLVVAELSSMP